MLGNFGLKIIPFFASEIGHLGKKVRLDFTGNTFADSI